MRPMNDPGGPRETQGGPEDDPGGPMGHRPGGPRRTQGDPEGPRRTWGCPSWALRAGAHGSPWLPLGGSKPVVPRAAPHPPAPLALP